MALLRRHAYDDPHALIDCRAKSTAASVAKFRPDAWCARRFKGGDIMSKVPALFYATSATLVLAGIFAPDPAPDAFTAPPVSTATIGELSQASSYESWLGQAHARAAHDADESPLPSGF